MRFCCAPVAALVIAPVVGLVIAPGHERIAHAQAPPDELRDAFGLDKKQEPPPAEDLRDTFDLGTRPPPASAASCSDGLALACAIATDPLDDATPYALSTWLPASYLLRLPVADATHDGVASYALGASRDDAGPALGGATGLENRWTIDGAPADSIRIGGADTRVPLVFLEGISVRAGGFSARDRASTGGTIDARLRRGTAAHELAVDAWSSLVRTGRERPRARGSYTVRRIAFHGGPDVTASLVATGPLAALTRRLGGATWYAAGIAPNLATREVSWQAARQLDRDQDGVPDGLPGDLEVDPFARTSTRTFDSFVPAMARLGLDRGAHRVELSLVGHVQRESRFFGNATLASAGVDRTTGTGDAIATWRASWPSTRVRGQLSWHRSARGEAARDDNAAGIPQLLSAYVPASLPDDPLLAAACDDASPLDPTKLITNCPVPLGLFASGGAGLLIDITGDRPGAAADIAHRIGDHVIRGGAALEDTRLVITSAFTGGEQQRTLFPGELSHRRFFSGSCEAGPGAPCDIVDASRLTYRTLYAAGYAEDTFTPVPGLSIDAGLRWELMWVGTRLRFSNQLAPRVGVTWDALGGGRSRLWASYARTHAMLPAGLGATVIQRDATVEDFEIGAMMARVRDAGAPYRVAAEVEPIAQDEVALGAQIALAGALRATLWGQGRWLRDGLETTGTTLGNPGGADPEATRETEVVAAALELVQPERISIRGGVMWGRAVGTWTGPHDPRQGANLLQSPAWDFDATNLYGPLPSDPGGRGFIEAEHRSAHGGVAVAVAARLSAGSGRPRDVLGNGAGGVVHLLPRGAAGRMPVIAQTNLRLAARWRGLTATLDVLNLFDRRDATNLDEIYSDDLVRPIAGGSMADLVSLKDEDGAQARRRAAFQLPTAFQPPLAISLGVHTAF